MTWMVPPHRGGGNINSKDTVLKRYIVFFQECGVFIFKGRFFVNTKRRTIGPPSPKPIMRRKFTTNIPVAWENIQRRSASEERGMVIIVRIQPSTPNCPGAGCPRTMRNQCTIANHFASRVDISSITRIKQGKNPKTVAPSPDAESVLKCIPKPSACTRIGCGVWLVEFFKA